jgi:hypothetical protein
LLLVLMALLLVLSVVLLLALPKRSRGERDPRRKQGTCACPVSAPCGLAPSLVRSAATSPVSVWLSPFAFASSVGAILPLPLLFEFSSEFTSSEQPSSEQPSSVLRVAQLRAAQLMSSPAQSSPDQSAFSSEFTSPSSEQPSSESTAHQLRAAQLRAAQPKSSPA